MSGPVQVSQPPPGSDDVADRRGLHDQQPGMMGDPVIVVGGPLARVQTLPDLAVEQLWDCGHLAGELAPARQRSQRPQPRIAVRSGRRIHHGRPASANGSKIGIGMT
jgi:hypothetical protein